MSPPGGRRTRDLVVLVPMLGRPHRVDPLAESVDATVPGARLLFLVSPHDDAVHQAVDRAGRERLTVEWRTRGDYARKINAGYRHTSEPLIFLGACDLLFHPGWMAAAVSRLAPGIGVVGTNDLGSPRVKAGQHATHSLVTREYADERGSIDRPGEILHEGYWHEFVDDELVATAQRRGAWAFADDSVVEHLHPNWGKAPVDPLYAAQRQRMRVGRRIFAERQRLWT